MQKQNSNAGQGRVAVNLRCLLAAGFRKTLSWSSWSFSGEVDSKALKKEQGGNTASHSGKAPGVRETDPEGQGPLRAQTQTPRKVSESQLLLQPSQSPQGWGQSHEVSSPSVLWTIYRASNVPGDRPNTNLIGCASSRTASGVAVRQVSIVGQGVMSSCRLHPGPLVLAECRDPRRVEDETTGHQHLLLTHA